MSEDLIKCTVLHLVYFKYIYFPNIIYIYTVLEAQYNSTPSHLYRNEKLPTNTDI